MPSPEAVIIVLRVSSQVLFITPWCTSFINFLCVFFRGLLAHIFSILYWGCWLILALRGCYISFSFTPTAVPIIIHLCTIIWNTFFEFCLSPTATSPMVSCSDSEEPEYSPNNWSSLARVLSPEKLIKYITKRYFCLFPKYIFFGKAMYIIKSWLTRILHVSNVKKRLRAHYHCLFADSGVFGSPEFILKIYFQTNTEIKKKADIFQPFQSSHRPRNLAVRGETNFRMNFGMSDNCPISEAIARAHLIGSGIF